MKTMKSFISAALLGSALLSLPAQADTVGGEQTLRPYAVGSLGALRDTLTLPTGRDNDTSMAGQIGLGAQVNEWLGGEIYYQHSANHDYHRGGASRTGVRNNTLGARGIVGTRVGDKARVFGKAGVAGVKHENSGEYKKIVTRPTAGVGASYELADNWALRADYDHYFKRTRNNSKPGWKNSDYFGAGVQYNF